MRRAVDAPGRRRLSGLFLVSLFIPVTVVGQNTIDCARFRG